MDEKVDPQNPWLGLASFREAHRDYFFGRSEEIRQLLQRISQNPLTVLFGKPGLGKTSLLQAGVVPRLREEKFLPVSIRLSYPEPDSESSEKELLSQISRRLSEALRGAGFFDAPRRGARRVI